MEQVNWIDDKSAKQGTHIDLRPDGGRFYADKTPGGGQCSGSPSTGTHYSWIEHGIEGPIQGFASVANRLSL